MLRSQQDWLVACSCCRNLLSHYVAQTPQVLHCLVVAIPDGDLQASNNVPYQEAFLGPSRPLGSHHWVPLVINNQGPLGCDKGHICAPFRTGKNTVLACLIFRYNKLILACNQISYTSTIQKQLSCSEDNLRLFFFLTQCHFFVCYR